MAFAGSIGIIGIAMILSLSNGVDRYIQSVEEETLQNYPLQITDTSFNFTSMYLPDAAESAEEDAAPTPKTDREVREWLTVTNMFSRVNSNDLASLRNYLESQESRVYDYVQAIEYDYSLTPQIFSLRSGDVRQVNPDRSFAALGFSATDGMNGLLSTFSSTDTFHIMPAKAELYLSQYDVMAGHWPERYDQCVLVLSSRGRVSDLTLYTMGLKDPAELEQMVKAFAQGEDTRIDRTINEYDYEDFLGISFRLVQAADRYVYDADYGVWTDRSEDQRFMRDLAERSETLTIVGVVQPKEDSSSPVLSMGIGYPASLIGHLIADAGNSAIVRSQLEDPDTNVFTGLPFGEDPQREDLDMGSLFSIDEDALSEAFQFDLDETDFDLSQLDLSQLDLTDLELEEIVDPEDLQVTMPTLTQEDISTLLGSVKINFSIETMEKLFKKLLDAYLEYAAQDPSTDYARLPESLEEYLNTQEAREILLSDIQEIFAENSESFISAEDIYSAVTDVMAGYPDYVAGLDPAEDEPPFAHLEEYLQSPEAAAIIQAHLQVMQEQAAGVVVTEEQLETLVSDLLEGYGDFARENELPDPARLEDSFRAFMETKKAKKIISQAMSEVLDTSELEKTAAKLFSRYSETMGREISSMLGKVVDALIQTISDTIQQNLGVLLESFARNLMDAFKMDADALADAFTMNMDPEELRDLMSSLMSKSESTYDSNLKKLGYADVGRPTAITIYPTDFNSKQEVKNILDSYNAAQSAMGREEKVIAYTDIVDTLMSSVTGIVNAISYVLIAFVAISLVVSSVMIGVITYISVLERKKEIGILRAIGASRGNISQVFNAETFIIGGLAGVFGVVITLLLLIPANHIIHDLTGQAGINAALPPGAAVLLIALSIVLTLIGGIIPSMKAAKSDPVTALRSE